MSLIRFCTLSVLCLGSTTNHAQSTPLPQPSSIEAQLQQHAAAHQLAQHAEWRRLLYFPDAQHTAEKSRVTQQSYFNAADGMLNPTHELQATLAGLFHPVAQADESVACHFPARRTWLAKQLNVDPDIAFPKANCPTYSRWINEVKPHQATLVFASDFLGNPSSMFGHTLLRIDQEKKTHNALVSYAINYSAQTASEHSVSFVWKGLTGGYPAAFSMMPYFEKVKEYGAMESRDLWEYPLNLTPQETLLLVNHAWEMREVKFPYYFLSKNCSYELLGLLDIARPSLQLQRQFTREVIPAQTVKAMAQKTDLIRDVVYRPALDTQLRDQSQQYGKQLSQRAHQLAENPALDLSDLPNADQAKVQEMAYDDLYTRFMAREMETASARPRLRQLLVLRSQNNTDIQRREIPVPPVSPANGHNAARLQVGVGRIQAQNTGTLEWRIAYHDLLDPVGGYRAGSHMDFLRAKVSYRDDQVKLDTLQLINIDSLTPISVFGTPSSWGIQLGWQQAAINKQGKFSPTEQHGIFNVQGQVGYSMGDTASTLCYMQAQSMLQAGRYLQNDLRVGVGPRLGCVQQLGGKARALMDISTPYWSDQHAWQLRSQLGLQMDLSNNNAIRLTGQYQQQKNQHFTGLEASMVSYF